MHVLLLEDNLLWSVRTKNGLLTLGHQVTIFGGRGKLPQADLAIVSLSARTFDPFELVSQLKSAGIKVIGHVGHKEKDLWKKGEIAGCDKVVSNGTLAKKLESVII